MKTNELKAKAEEMAYNDYHINAGVDRKVVINHWEKGEKKRDYIDIKCYSLAGNSKGTYKCGYVDCVSGEYICTKYDDVDLEHGEYIGR